MARLSETEGEWQHRGLGRQLMQLAEDAASNAGYSSIKVTSGVGVRGYYASLGYEKALPHMRKGLRGDK
jgi:elongator complex protein 3